MIKSFHVYIYLTMSRVEHSSQVGKRTTELGLRVGRLLAFRADSTLMNG